MSQSNHANTPLTLYSHVDDHYCHRIRLALAIKQVSYQLILVDDANEDVSDLNPYNRTPTLVEQDLRLFEPQIMIEYLDERYRQHKLMPDSPITRAEHRQYAWRVEQDWMRLANILLRHPDSLDLKAQQKAKKQLTDIFTNLNPFFQHFPYFMNEKIGIVDCMFAPILLRLDSIGITLSQSQQALIRYRQRLFELPTFKQSLTEQEKRRYAYTSKNRSSSS